MNNIVGQRISRIDAIPQIRGEVIYGDDYLIPGTIFGKVLGSPYPHAKIKKVDISKAANYPGVHAIITAEDIPNNAWGFTHIDQPALCFDKVRRVGDPVVAIAADTEQIAAEALRLVEIEYEVLPAVFDPLEALMEDAPQIHEKGNLVKTLRFIKGNVEEAWPLCDQIIEEVYRTQRTQHCHLEPRNTLVKIDDDGTYNITSSSQRVFRIREDTSKILGVPEDRVVVTSLAVGGAFGAKTEISNEPLACILAQKSGRPVKMVLTRSEEFSTSPIRHEMVAKYKTGVTLGGDILARKIELFYDTGAYVSQGSGVLTKASVNCNGPYEVDNIQVISHLIYTNSNVGSAFRGFGVPQIAFAYESHTDSIAHHIGMDPVEFRKKNFLRDQSVLTTGQIIQNPLAEETLNEALKMIN